MPKVKTFRKPPNLPELEKEILEFWKQDQTFEKSIEQREGADTFSFYDGPPFATGLPHYGHLLASTSKDVFPRYQTMKGKQVDRVWGWDCHGLPIENMIEKELNLGTKKDIEEMGVAQFNEACRSKVLRYTQEWKETVERLGRWVDMEHAYKTMDPEFMESVWWVFKELWKKGLIYKGHKSMHLCPRCSTPLSNFEVTQGYQEVKDLSVTAQFELKEQDLIETSEPVYILAWTTTPWTLPGNVLLAVNPNIAYSVVKVEGKSGLMIIAKERSEAVLADQDYQVIQTAEGGDLVGLEYQPLFPYFSQTENAFKVVAADFVSTEEGTGIVHIAPAFGEDDYHLGLEHKVPLVQHVNMEGEFTQDVTDFAGMLVKPKENPIKTDIEILKYLQERDLAFSKSTLKHSYPHCWRCDTPLLNYAMESWFVKVSAFKDQLLANNQKTNWVPDHFKHGRFGNWLEGAIDWAISRNRYWGTPLPVWQAEDGDTICVGSKQELEELSGVQVSDLHKHKIDQIEIEQGGKLYKRVPEVLDCWFESGTMPYGQMHYPFENQEKFQTSFPADFISEGQDQTRGWFYTLHVLATALTLQPEASLEVEESVPAFMNVIVSGIILAEDGKKMSKRLKNYPEPSKILDQYGADSLRLYLMSSPVMKAEALNFSEDEVAQLRRKVFLLWWNMIAFFKLFAQTEVNVTQLPETADHVLDRWLLSRLNSLTREVEAQMDQYDVVRASRALIEFVDQFSTWYLRLSRDRIKADNNRQVSQIFGAALYHLAKLYAPFTPFFSELVHHNLVDENSSIHLSDWPEAVEVSIDHQLEQEMQSVVQIVELGRSQRREQGVKLRHPLASISVLGADLEYQQQLSKLIKNELNVKDVVWAKSKADQLQVKYDFELTPELKAEAEAKDLIREIQTLRKQAKLKLDETVKVQVPEWPQAFEAEIQERTNTVLVAGDELKLL